MRRVKSQLNMLRDSGAVQKRSHRRIAILASMASAFASSAYAGNTWDGGGANNNWSDNANWNPDGQPGYGTLTFSGSTRTTNSDDNITAMNQLLWTGTSAWTLNQGGSTVLSLFDNGGTQAKIENQSTGLVTINLPITFAANNSSPPNPFGEINAVNGDLTFGTGTLTVSGSSVNGIKLFGSARTVTFNNTISAGTKWFGFTTGGTGNTAVINGTVTSGDWYVMNNGTLNISSTANMSGAGVIRMGGDFGNTGNQDQTKNGTLQLTGTTGGTTFGNIINSVTGATGTLLVNSQNTTGTNTLNGNIFLDSNLRFSQSSGGTLSISSSTFDIKAQTVTFLGSGGSINVSSTITNSTGSGQVVIGTNGTAGTGGTVTLSAGSTYSGDTFVRNGTLAYTSTGSTANSTIRLGSTSGTTIDAAIAFSGAGGNVSISNTINPVTTSGSGTVSLNSQNTSGTNTYGGHIGLDRNFTITQTAGGTLNITQARSGVTTTTGADIKGFTLTLTSPAGAGGTINFSGDIYNSTGSGKVAIGTSAGVTSTVTLSGNNTYTGTTTVNSGSTLNINSATALGTGQLTSGGNFTINNTSAGAITNTNNNALNLGSGSMTFTGTQSLNFGTGAVTIGATGRTITTTASTLTLGGVISSGGGSLTKAGAGTLVLTGGNTYATGTTINAGTLLANSSDVTNGSTGSGAVDVNNTGTLGGSGIVKGAVNVNNGGSITGGTATGVGNLTTGAQTWVNGGSYVWNISDATGGTGTGWDILNFSTLNVSLGGPSDTFTIKIVGAGIANFNHNLPYVWRIALGGNGTTNSISNFVASKFVLDTSGFTGNGFSPGDFFTVSQDANHSEIDINYVPEPASGVVILAIAGAATMRRRVRRAVAAR